MSNALARRIESIGNKAKMKPVDIANVLKTSPMSVSRWNSGQAYPKADLERLLLDLDYIVDQLSDFYEPEEARLWLFSRQKLLTNKRPADLIQEGRVDEVISILDQLRDGIYL